MSAIYSLLGVRLRVPFPLPMPTAPGAQWDYDVRVERCARGVRSERAPQPSRHWQPRPDGWSLRFENAQLGVCDFRCSEPDRLLAITTSESDADLVAPTTGPALAALLHRRGDPVWHGTALARDGRAILIVGASGGGKSTLSACLCAEGWALLSEDMSVCGPNLELLAGLSALRVSAASAEVVGLSPGTLAPVMSAEFSDGKFWVPASLLRGGGCTESQPLAAVHILGPRATGPTRRRQIPRALAAAALMEHRFGSDWFGGSPALAFQTAVRVAHAVPVFDMQLEDHLGVVTSQARLLTELHVHAHP